MTSAPILAPVVALTAWTHLMLLWMYATRIPAVRAARMRLDPNAPRGAQMAELPPKVRWKADNFTHLTEHPTVFYATALALAALAPEDRIALGLAWVYVALRIAHSLVQALYNRIVHRFVLFGLSSVTAIGLTIRALQAL
ncbi:MAG: MAPEG family protein [Sandaracinus sp.]|nr:MAPEG family protein [Sandaracinus sp.]MCB9614981.1 MAPEG family protein [Sandaracinus sp.]